MAPWRPRNWKIYYGGSKIDVCFSGFLVNDGFDVSGVLEVIIERKTRINKSDG
jgi:hypothetical protein